MMFGKSSHPAQDSAVLVAGHTTLGDLPIIGERWVSAVVDMAASATCNAARAVGETASSATSTLEDFGRRNPIAAMGAALLLGMLLSSRTSPGAWRPGH